MHMIISQAAMKENSKQATMLFGDSSELQRSEDNFKIYNGILESLSDDNYEKIKT